VATRDSRYRVRSHRHLPQIWGMSSETTLLASCSKLLFAAEERASEARAPFSLLDPLLVDVGLLAVALAGHAHVLAHCHAAAYEHWSRSAQWLKPISTCRGPQVTPRTPA